MATVIKKSCKECYYWTGKSIDKAYKCYCGSCPAKVRDEKEKESKMAELMKRAAARRLDKRRERVLKKVSKGE
jgi:hypothetical protein